MPPADGKRNLVQCRILAICRPQSDVCRRVYITKQETHVNALLRARFVSICTSSDNMSSALRHTQRNCIHTSLQLNPPTTRQLRTYVLVGVI